MFICSDYHDKRDKFKFSVVRLTPRFSNQTDNVGNIAPLLHKLPFNDTNTGASSYIHK